MKSEDYRRISHAAIRGEIPPIPFALLHLLMQQSNYRWQSHPSVRKLERAGLVGHSVIPVNLRWLEDRLVIKVYRKPKAVSMYEIQPPTKWDLLREPVQIYNVKLYRNTTQIAVPPDGTDVLQNYRETVPGDGTIIQEDSHSAGCDRRSPKGLGDEQASPVEHDLRHNPSVIVPFLPGEVAL